MAAINKRLLCLNLALVLALLFILPSAASARSIALEELAVPPPSRSSSSPLTYNSDRVSLLSTVSDAFLIYVNDIEVYSNTDASGPGWIYTAATNTLALDGYDGCEIFSNGDLTVTCTGEVSVAAKYLNPGIYAVGSLDLLVQGGSLTVCGATSNTLPCAAVAAEGDVSCYSSSDSYVYFAGGNTAGSKIYGGDSLCSYGGSVTLSGANFSIVGGVSQSYYGGSGIYALDTVTVLADDCAVQAGSGGSSSTHGLGIEADCISIYGENFRVGGSSAICGTSISIYGNGCEASGTSYCVIADTISIHGGTQVDGYVGIYYTGSCYIGAASVTVSGDLSAFAWADTASEPSWSEHVTLSGSSRNCVFTINQYTLSLSGNGGLLPTGAASLSLKAQYPTSYQLGHYLFQLEGCVQIAWETDTQIYPLNAAYLPESNCLLSAKWLEVSSGEIILNGLSGTFPDGSFYQKYSGTQVLLSSSLAYSSDETFLMAWCTEVASTPDSLTQFYTGQWYSPGDTVAPKEDDASVYYGRAHTGGTYAIYHPTDGILSGGGTILVQGTDAAETSLTAYAADASYLTAPEGYELAGWSLREGGTEADYAPGAPISLAENSTIHLYACWKEIDPVTVSKKAGNLIQIDITKRWCEESGAQTVICALYDTSGKMLACTTAALTGEALRLEFSYDGTPDHCTVFGLDGDYAPTCAAITCEVP